MNSGKRKTEGKEANTLAAAAAIPAGWAVHLQELRAGWAVHLQELRAGRAVDHLELRAGHAPFSAS